jgi:hypothetical protein
MARPVSEDPRSIVTPDAFQVAPEMLGLPLAEPWRRLVALLVDLLLIGILSQLGGTALALTAVVFFVLLARREKSGRSSPRARLMVGCLALLIVAVTVPAVVGIVALVRSPGAVSAVGRSVAEMAELEQLGRASSREDAVRAASGAAAGMRRLGIPPDEIERVLRSEMPDSVWGPEVMALALSPLDSGASTPQGAGEPQAPADSAVGGSPPGEAGEPVATVPPPALPQAAMDSLAVLEGRVARLQGEAAALRGANRRQASELEALRARDGDGFLVRLFRNIFEDLGLAFGFGTIYLTVFTAWWQGRTPGKRLLGLRVLQLDGRPLTWWAAFERAGGYAAGLATGLLGFAQVLWDPNRQAIHDRISATVVVLDGRPPVPGRWRHAVDSDPGRGVRYDFDSKDAP